MESDSPPPDAELTTQQVADVLNVSRQYVAGLLDQGVIDYRVVDADRRVKTTALIEYLRRDNAKRREAMDELTRLSIEMGLYETPFPADT